MKTTKLLSLIILSVVLTSFSVQFVNKAEARMDYSNPARYEKQACYPLCGLQQYEKKVADANAQTQAQNQNTNPNYNSNYNSSEAQLGTNDPNNPMFTYNTGGNANYNGNNQNPNYYTATNQNTNRNYQDPQRLSQSGPMSYVIFLIVIMGTYGIVFFIRRKRKQMLSLAI